MDQFYAALWTYFAPPLTFQQDRFVHNWRKVGEGEKYPRYEKIRGKFINDLGKLRRFLKAQNLGQIDPNQCEVTYVNHISSGDGEDLLSDLGSVFRFWSKGSRGGLISGLENGRFTLRYVMKRTDGSPFGRLIVDAAPGRTSEGTPVIRLSLTARGQPQAPTNKAVIEFLNAGREMIVDGFAELTTKKMHTRWGRTQ